MSTMIATPELYNDVSWYHNSSASNNITPDANNLMQRQEITGQDRVHIGNGTGWSTKTCQPIFSSVSL